ncbi:MAG: SDR family oxidoreductase [Pseudonocardia sp.]|uniref:SDR family NAD(P)-dependent oxidoreductase n=1 Tax=unclassified Pseudonocardia TaxID=2619320 RepID=UPI00086BAD51|nr:MULTISPECIES: SDR family oxidoreductase [unclassified Pseudonocardia]MBN9110449.1 SDR family oxidoreductase [Pseudonocardia sp.]ODU29772.1 MAG: hypothetical protein ABS80_01260 [Pseudonocardia sp. SCN 72-51]ODV03469.1 MAG: hypothetical protein ABT15_22835 [Pseudonocardia sp. SCN 73-27]
MTDPVALVTGAQQGIGAACVLALAGAGHDVAVHWHDDEAAAAAVAAGVRAAGRRAFPLRADLATPGAAADLVDRAAAASGRLDVLVNNAGIYPRAELADLEPDQLRLVLAVDLEAPIQATRAAVPHLRAQDGGVVVNIASSAVRGAADGVAYTAAKGGLVAASRSMALGLARHGIRVNCVSPGIVDTDQPRVALSEPEIAAIGARIPLGRIGLPADVAGVVAFLASPAGAYLTGQNLHVNGGSHMPD